MIKKILKLTVAVMTLGLFTTSVFAADWGVSGQARVDWDIAKTIEETGKPLTDNDIPGTKRTPNGIYIDLDDSWVSFGLTGESASGAMTYYPSGGSDFSGSASAESGEWTSSATVNVRVRGTASTQAEARAGDSDVGGRSGDHTVSVAHSGGFSVKAGYTTPLHTFVQGRGYLLMGESGSVFHVTDVASGANVTAMDNRSSVVDFGFKVGDALSLGLVIEQSDSGLNNLGTAFGSIGYGDYANSGCSGDDGDRTVTNCGVSASNTGIKVNYSGGPVSVGLISISASEAADVASGSESSTYKASASSLGLGVGLKFGAVAPFLNIWMPSTTSENAVGSDETNTSATNIGVDYALNETSGISFSIVTRLSSKKDTLVGAGTRESRTAAAATEIGYSTKIGGANFYLGYVSAAYAHNPRYATTVADETALTATSEIDLVTVSWLKARLQSTF